MQRKMDAFSYIPFFTGTTVLFDKSTENCSIAQFIRVGFRMFYLSKIHNIGYILLKQTPLKIPETLKETLAVVSLQTKKLTIVIKVVQNQENVEGVSQFWENYILKHSILKESNVRAPTTIK